MIKICIHLSELVPCTHISLRDLMDVGDAGVGTETAAVTGNSPRVQDIWIPHPDSNFFPPSFSHSPPRRN